MTRTRRIGLTCKRNSDFFARHVHMQSFFPLPRQYPFADQACVVGVKDEDHGARLMAREGSDL